MEFSRQEYWSEQFAIFSSRGSSQVTEDSLFALVLDTLLLQLVIFSDISKVLWRVMVLALSQGVGRLPSSVSSWACSSPLLLPALGSEHFYAPFAERSAEVQEGY